MGGLDRARLVAVAGLAALAMAGCGGGDDPTGRPERQVERKQQALTEAQAELQGQTAAFCRSSATYIKSLDRYGDLLARSEPTVGDVKEAGADLTEPRADVLSSAEQVRSAREKVATAERELADAYAELASVKPSTSVPPSASPAPTPPGTAVNRVKQADADFAAASAAITDGTPVKQASEDFNAAAVALEMSWIKLFTDAGCLTEDQYEQARAAARDYTLALQKSLAEAGYLKGEVDGVYGPATVEAVQALQKAHDLPVTGTVDKATDAALRADLQAKGGAEADQDIAATAAVQQTLKLAGYWPGPVDGNWTDALTEALKAFQTSLHVEPTGEVDAATIAAVERGQAQRSASPATTPSAATSK
jgi:murein L,D-transpeptidase YcbB/YkuD